MKIAFSPACSASIHTTIGMPDFYWRHGSGAFLGFLLVLLLVEVGVVVMVDAVPWWSDDPRLWVPSGQRVPPSSRTTFVRLFEMMAPLIAAALLLQWLPETRSGIQFLPVSPWAFSGWIPFVISLVVWAGIGGCVLVVLMPVMDKLDGLAFFLLVTMGVNVLLSFWPLHSS